MGTLHFLYSIIWREGIKPEHLFIDNFHNHPCWKPFKWQPIVNRAGSLFDSPYVALHFRNMFIFCHNVQCDTRYYLACVKSLELSISQYVGYFENIVCIDFNDLVLGIISGLLYVSSGSACAEPNCRSLEIVTKNGMSLTYMISIDSTNILRAEDFGVVAWEILTCVDLALTVFPFKHPRSGSNMSSAARMSCFTIGQFGKRLLSTIAINFLRHGCPIVFCIFWARVALNTCHLEYLPLFSSTVFRIVSFSNCLFSVSDCFYDLAPHTHTSLPLTERMPVWDRFLGVLRTCFHFGCQK